MTYYKDLHSKDNQIYVGWLSHHRPFKRGTLDAQAVEKLVRLCDQPSVASETTFCCELCRYSWRGIVNALFRWPTLACGSGVIHIECVDGTIYCAPTLIAHYVTVHGYCPPDEFIEALVSDA